MEITDGWRVAHLVMHTAFDELREASVIAKGPFPESTNFKPAECLALGAKVEMQHSELRKHLIKATVLFQAGMEAMINHWCSKYSGLSNSTVFAKKWEESFQAKNITKSFDGYSEFYRKTRNAVTHPDREERIEKINNIQFLEVFYGIKEGWESFKVLSNALGEQHDQDSWGTMCQIHNISPDCSEEDFPNMVSLKRSLFKKAASF